MKRCNCCGAEKPLADYPPDKQNRDLAEPVTPDVWCIWWGYGPRMVCPPGRLQRESGRDWRPGRLPSTPKAPGRSRGLDGVGVMGRAYSANASRARRTSGSGRWRR